MRRSLVNEAFVSSVLILNSEEEKRQSSQVHLHLNP